MGTLKEHGNSTSIKGKGTMAFKFSEKTVHGDPDVNFWPSLFIEGFFFFQLLANQLNLYADDFQIYHFNHLYFLVF